MNTKDTYLVKGIFENGTHSINRPVSGLAGHPIEGARCCINNPYIGTHNELLSSEPAPVSGYGLSYYSNFRQTHLLSDKQMLELNRKMERDNINLEDVFDRKYRDKKEKKNRK